MPDPIVWVVRWSHPSQAPALDRETVAAILPGRTDIRRVAALVEELHASRAYTLGEKLERARRRWDDPYPASIDTKRHVVTCGHSPFLEAFRCRARLIGSQAEETLVEE